MLASAQAWLAACASCHALGQIAADIAGRHAEHPADSAEDMRMVLAHAAPLLQRLGAGGVHVRLALAVLHLIGDGRA